MYSFEVAKPQKRTPWMQELRHSYRDPLDLVRLLELSEPRKFSKNTFKIQATDYYLSRINKGDWADPLLLQIWPNIEEDREVPGYTSDPVGEKFQFHSKGIIEKYHDRSLVVTTSVCAIHCRYCFRREFPYETENSVLNLTNHLKEKNPREVIFSGGDPFTQTNTQIKKWFEATRESPSVKIVRFHTRIPSVLPSRFDEELFEIFREIGSRFRIVLVTHINHAQEIGEEVIEVCRKLHRTGVTLLNQSVLLRGVNDTLKNLCDLSWRLSDASIQPYYLHQLDPVKGAHHFFVSQNEGLSLQVGYQSNLPGHLCPRYVVEKVGESNKVDVTKIYGGLTGL